MSSSINDKLKEKFKSRAGISPHDIIMGGEPVLEKKEAPKTVENNKVRNEELKTAIPPKKAIEKPVKEEVVPQPENLIENEIPNPNHKKSFRRNKEKFVDLYTQESYYVNNDIYKAMKLLLGWGEKTYFVNEAFKRLILEDEDCVAHLEENDAELLDRIRKL